jgi:arylsulfatase A-like enzyme
MPESRFDRREFVKTSALTVASALLPSGCSESRESKLRSDRPNLLFVLTDDQNFEAIGYASGGRVITPNLDRMAAQGTIFETAYCNAMPCTPSRGTLMSGLHWNRWKRTGSHDSARLLPGEWTWAHALREADVATALIGKMHFAPMRADHGFEHAEYCESRHRRIVAPGQPVEDDYERWLSGFGLKDPQAPGLRVWPYDDKYHPISWTRDRAIAYLEGRERNDRPFCLTVSFRNPHAPYVPGRSFAALYDPASIEIPRDAWDDMEGLPEKLRVWNDYGWFPRAQFTEPFLQRRFAYYYALITQIDDAVGAILRHVNLEDTLVLFTSDHGLYLGHRGRVGKHPFLPFEMVGRVPFVACGYGVSEGVKLDQPVGLIDLAPTLLTAAGLEVPPALDGWPLQDYFRDPAHGADRPLFCWGLTDFNMTRRGSAKYFRSHDRSEEMLFDLSTDPGELRNLAGAPEWRELKSALAREMDAVESRAAPDLPRFPRSTA